MFWSDVELGAVQGPLSAFPYGERGPLLTLVLIMLPSPKGSEENHAPELTCSVTTDRILAAIDEEIARLNKVSIYSVENAQGGSASPSFILWMSNRQLPGKTLAKFITANFGIPEREQKLMVERISDAVADTAPVVRETMNDLVGFRDTGKRMLAAWGEGVNHLRDSRMYGLSPWKSGGAFEAISDPPKLKGPRTIVGRSELLAGTRKRT